MKTYLIASDTNYGLMVHVVNADSKEEAEAAASKHFCPPWHYAHVIEVPTDRRGIVAYLNDSESITT